MTSNNQVALDFNRGLNVLSLFDGISCGMVALKRLGTKVNSYRASEIEESAIKCAMHNHPEIMQVGDITQWIKWGIDWSSIDLVLAGSPCQGFSSAGKGEGFNDPRSGLIEYFFQIVEHIKSQNPSVNFLLENVRMKSKDMDIISQRLQRAPVNINSLLVSAQMRNRFYWANFDFTVPDDKGIVMADILEPGYYSTRPKAYCIDANYGKGTNFKRYFFRSSRHLVLKDGYNPGPITEQTANEIMHNDGNQWRKLSVLECERLQTLDDGYIDNVDISTNEKYHGIGNGWTVDVICHILKGLNNSDN